MDNIYFFQPRALFVQPLAPNFVAPNLFSESSDPVNELQDLSNDTIGHAAKQERISMIVSILPGAHNH